MTNYAVVAPLGIHQQLEATHDLGPYNLLIASEILRSSVSHQKFWHKRAADGKHFTIMDNGLIELGYPLPVKDLIKAADLVQASVVVLPDTIDDGNMTRKQVRHSIVEWRKAGYPTRTMGVVQGRTFAECVDTADSHLDAGVDFLAVPRGLTPNLGSRIDLVHHLVEELDQGLSGVRLHLLGFSENVQDDILAVTVSDRVMGIDTATPVWLGMAGRAQRLTLRPPTTANYGRRPEWFWKADLQGEPAANLIRANVRQVREWLAAARLSRGVHDQIAVKSARIVRDEQLGPLVP